MFLTRLGIGVALLYLAYLLLAFPLRRCLIYMAAAVSCRLLIRQHRIELHHAMQQSPMETRAHLIEELLAVHRIENRSDIAFQMAK